MQLPISGPRRGSLVCILAAAAPLAGSVVSAAEVTLPTVSLGAGMRTSFENFDNGTDKSSDFDVDSARLYINGSVTDKIKFTFNSEYNGNELILMDAIARFEYSDKMNIWAGRLLPPSDRANLYGPYYANNWAVYIDGVQDMWPNTAVGRDEGVLYWGQFNMVKLSAGVFDVPQTLGPSDSNAFDADLLYAGRAQIDLWDAEDGYYLNGTYYGDKDLLAFGVAAQSAGDYTAWSADFLFEKKLGNGGAIGVESEYYAQTMSGPVTDTDYDGYYGLVHYVFPTMGPGKFQLLAKYGEAGTDGSPTITTTELNLNYLIKTFNARGSLFFTEQKSDAVGAQKYTTIGLGLQLQM